MALYETGCGREYSGQTGDGSAVSRRSVDVCDIVHDSGRLFLLVPVPGDGHSLFQPLRRIVGRHPPPLHALLASGRRFTLGKVLFLVFFRFFFFFFFFFSCCCFFCFFFFFCCCCCCCCCWWFFFSCCCCCCCCGVIFRLLSLEELSGLRVRRGQSRVREDPALCHHQTALCLGRDFRRSGPGGRFRRFLLSQTEAARHQRVPALLCQSPVRKASLFDDYDDYYQLLISMIIVMVIYYH